jgi:hypothetical protein
MKRFLYFGLLSIALSAGEGTASCRIHEFRKECERDKVCVWDSRGCSVGSHPLEAVSEGQVQKGDTVQDNF